MSRPTIVALSILVTLATAACDVPSTDAPAPAHPSAAPAAARSLTEWAACIESWQPAEEPVRRCTLLAGDHDAGEGLRLTLPSTVKPAVPRPPRLVMDCGGSRIFSSSAAAGKTIVAIETGSHAHDAVYALRDCVIEGNAAAGGETGLWIGSSASPRQTITLELVDVRTGNAATLRGRDEAGLRVSDNAHVSVTGGWLEGGNGSDGRCIAAFSLFGGEERSVRIRGTRFQGRFLCVHADASHLLLEDVRLDRGCTGVEHAARTEGAVLRLRGSADTPSRRPLVRQTSGKAGTLDVDFTAAGARPLLELADGGHGYRAIRAALTMTASPSDRAAWVVAGPGHPDALVLEEVTIDVVAPAGSAAGRAPGLLDATLAPLAADGLPRGRIRVGGTSVELPPAASDGSDPPRRGH